MKYQLTKMDSFRGLISAILIIIMWTASIVFELRQNLNDLQYWHIAFLILWQTFLYTGLFITAHDAMHGTAFYTKKTLNKIIGMISVLLYAMFSYKKLLTKHHQHHKSPGTQNDPDFHDGEHKGFWMWYIHFLFTYLTWKQFLAMAIIFNILYHLLNIPLANLVLFWILPSVLSTLQLFYFGTFLPHRESPDKFKDHHRARSNDYNIIFSFVTCYHFGYHWEHHQYPYVPWWKLPKVRQQIIQSSLS
jgi:beta-carotene ketolase (CrtW type)